MKERKCANCNNWSPHNLYSFVGYCYEKKKLSFSEYFCELFIELELEEEFYWCGTCRSIIESEEVKEHISKRHRISRRAFMDPDYREEIYEG
ncbi:MAG: hypothetical protein QXQ38_00440 [Archaeoglobaceae archaeon]|nr:hypothetical protein [Archaeoglobales archaeon]